MNISQLRNANIQYDPFFIEATEALRLFEKLKLELPWEHTKIKLFGKEFDIPRTEAYFADKGMTYGYSGKKLTLNPWNPELLTLKKRIEQQTGHSFNACLANFYRDGNDSNGLHADNEVELGKNPVIASLSFGATRKFRLKHNETKEVVNYELTNGSLLIMSGECQHFWKHEVPKQKKIQEGRINLTFRRIFER